MSDHDIPKKDHDKVLAGEYALGLLPQDEAEEFAARLKAEPELRALYAAWVEDFAGLADDLPDVTPPGSVMRNIEAQLFKGKEISILARLRMWWLAGVVVAAAVVIAVFAGLFETGPRAPANPDYRADIAAEDGSLIVAAAYDAATGRLFLKRLAGRAAPDRAFELWLIAGDNPPVSLGVLPETDTAELTVRPDLRQDLGSGILAISDEPTGGSPTGQVTGPVLAIGPVTKT
jgi:anti-sigma-K factor RskA